MIRAIRRTHTATAVFLSACALANATFADVFDTTWLGATDTWHNASQWSGGVVPNNGGANTFNATVPAGTVRVTNQVTIDTLDVHPGATVQDEFFFPGTFSVLGNTTVDGLLRVEGSVRVGQLSGNGTIQLGSAGAGSAARLSGIAGLNIGNGLHLTIQGNGGSRLGTADQPFVNNGSIFGGESHGNFVPLISGSTFSNLGTIEARNGCISFGGKFTRADLGNLSWASNGTFGIGFGGTLLNQGQTLTVDAAHPWELNGGTIQGGTLQIDPSTRLFIGFPFAGANYSGTLDGVTVNGKIVHTGAGPLALADGNLAGNADIALLTSAPEGQSRLVSKTSSLTINSSALVHGGGQSLFGPGTAPGIGDGSSAIINHGTIRSDGGEFVLIGTSVMNDGTLAINPGTTMHVANSAPITLTFGAGGVLDIYVFDVAPTYLQVVGQLDLSGVDSLVLRRGATDNSFYRIVTTTSPIIGQFDSVTPNFEVDYRGNEIWARFVPEPSITTTACGASVFALARRRRCNLLEATRSVR